MAEMKQTVDTKNSLKLDNGAVMEFEGQNFAEVSWFEDGEGEDSNCIKRQRIYTTQTGAQVYSISESSSIRNSHRAYMLDLQENTLHINNGKTSLDLDKDLFMLFIKGMLDKVEANSEATLTHIDELLKAANS